MAMRDFDSEIGQGTESIGFKLFGKRWNCAPDVNGKRLLDHVALMDTESVADQRDGTVAIFQEVLDNNAIDEFMDILDDPSTIVPLGKLVEIAGWLAEQYMDRPTQPPERSGNGRAPAGRTSTAKPRAKASNSRRSERQTSST